MLHSQQFRGFAWNECPYRPRASGPPTNGRLMGITKDTQWKREKEKEKRELERRYAELVADAEG